MKSGKKRKINVPIGTNFSLGAVSFEKVFLTSRPRGYKTFFVLSLTERETFPAHNNCWHFNMYEREYSILGLSELKNAEFLGILYV